MRSEVAQTRVISWSASAHSRRDGLGHLDRFGGWFLDRLDLDDALGLSDLAHGSLPGRVVGGLADGRRVVLGSRGLGAPFACHTRGSLLRSGVIPKLLRIGSKVKGMNESAPPGASAAPSLPTTAYAILGLLALREWSAYELTRQLRRSLDWCWPTAESVWYDEPKRLVRLGLATARREQTATGRRARTVYAITGQGGRCWPHGSRASRTRPGFRSRPCSGSSTQTRGPSRTCWQRSAASGGGYWPRCRPGSSADPGLPGPGRGERDPIPAPAAHHCPFPLVLRQRVRADNQLGGPG